MHHLLLPTTTKSDQPFSHQPETAERGGAWMILPLAVVAALTAYAMMAIAG